MVTTFLVLSKLGYDNRTTNHSLQNTLVRLKESAYQPHFHMVSKNARSRALRRRRGDRRGARANGSELLARTSEGRARIVRTTTARIGPYVAAMEDCTFPSYFTLALTNSLDSL